MLDARYDIESLEKMRQLYGDKPSEELAICLNNLALAYRYQENWNKAEATYIEALNTYRRLFGSKPDSESSNILNNLASLYLSQGRWSEAEPLFQEALCIRRQLFSQTVNSDLAISLNNLAQLYSDQGRWSEAEPLFLEALGIFRQLFHATQDKGFITILSNLAGSYLSQGRWSKAESLLSEALLVSRQLFGKTPNIELAISLNNLAGLYLSQGRWPEAEPLFLEALNIYRQLPSKNDLATCLGNVAALYCEQGWWPKAEPLFLEALSIHRQLFGQTANNNLANTLNHLALLYTRQGKWTDAKPLYLEALDIRRRLFDKTANNDLANSLNSLAQLYSDEERWSEAEPLFLEALDIRRQLFEKTANSDLAISLNNLAQLYSSQGRLAEAEPLFLETLSIYRQLFGQRPNNYLAHILNNLGLLYIDQGRLVEAEPLFIEALSIRRQLFGKTANNDLANSLNSLALLYSRQENWIEAESLYLEALSIYHELFEGIGHPSLVAVHQDYAYLQFKQGQFAKAIAHFAAAARVDLRVLAVRFQGQTEAERLAYRNHRQFTVDSLLSCLWQHLAEDTGAITQAFEVIYLWKSVATSVEIALNSAISRGEDRQLQQIATERQKLGRSLIQLLRIPPTENIESYKQEISLIQNKISTLNKEIAAKVPRSELMETTIDRQTINLLIPSGAILVDFVRFDLYDLSSSQKKEGIPHYLAFVLTDVGLDGIQLVKLGAAREIEELITKFRQAASDLPGFDRMSKFEDAPLKNPTGLLVPHQTEANNLRQAIFDPLEISSIHQHIIFAPDGALNLVPLGILPLDSETIGDRWAIRYISASRDLRPRTQPPEPATLGAIVANPNYDFPTDAIAPTPTAEIQKSGTVSTLGNKLSPLPDTEPFAVNIARSLGTKAFVNDEAQVVKLRQVRSPKYLVIATHGLHGLEPEEGNPDPMRDAGLAFAGFNTYHTGDELPPEFEKGLMTARDLLELDLWGTQLAILLACSSGTGSIRQGEGIFGLKRALAIAGVPTLIVSLWDVPVQASILLMDKFFEYYREDENQPASVILQKAQSYIRNISRQELLVIEQGQVILHDLEG
ncbi:MAG: CHAT domain-containing tetratricopeptide repeat protein [Thermosynechococcaceae cyanobacterium]